MAYEKIYIFLFLMLGSLSGSMAAVYQVGDVKGWNSQGTDYRSWVSGIRFQVGDTIVFSYNPQFHDVREVSKEEYNACSAMAPRATYNSGNDAILLSSPSSYYFICSFPGMCQAGQKVEIKVDTSGKSPSQPISLVPPLANPSNPTPPCGNSVPGTYTATNGVPIDWYYSASSPVSSYNYLGFRVVLASSVLAFWLH